MAFDHIVAGCRAMLEAVPEDRLDWRPHEKSWTLGELATHIAMIPNWTVPTLTMSEFDIDPEDGGPPPNPELGSLSPSAAELVAALDQSAAAARASIESTSDETFATRNRGRSGNWRLTSR
ncbi:DinB family protein [Candidatus Palauibacter sp.]|uniref:DinB family protein n=1 Tax=Candidatus Palauibacter sp. TaxID=3101350 RepID=UPI003AF318D3